MSNNWQLGIASHKGTKKERNEDSSLHLLQPDQNGNDISLFAVADGMGGYERGDAASNIAITELNKWWDRRIQKIIKKKDALDRAVKETEKLFHDINKAVQVLGRHTGSKTGTTLSVLLMYKGEYASLHVGDSRIYHMKDWHYGFQQYFHHESQSADSVSGLLDEQPTEILENEPELLQLTKDHSWVGKQIEAGLMDEEEARNHPKRNVLTQCLGIGDTIDIDSRRGTYQSTDLFLLCSDGFYSLYSKEEIQNMLISLEKEYGNLQSICDYLVHFSNYSQAYDNVTLLLVRNFYVHQEQKSKKTIFSFLPGN